MPIDNDSGPDGSCNSQQQTAKEMKKRSASIKNHVPHRDHRNASLDIIYHQIESEVNGKKNIDAPKDSPSKWSYYDCLRMILVLIMCSGVVIIASKKQKENPRMTFPPNSTSRSTRIVDPKTMVHKETIQLNSFQERGETTIKTQYGAWSPNQQQQPSGLGHGPDNYIYTGGNQQLQMGDNLRASSQSNSQIVKPQEEPILNGFVGTQNQGYQHQLNNGIHQGQQQSSNQRNQPHETDVTWKSSLANTGQQYVQPSTTNEAQKYRILTLGGSTTWGSKLENREDAYPYVLANLMGPKWSSVNLAVRATDASYASQCIETMVREGVLAEDIEMDFDVIMLEYSLNGLDGMPLLLERLRRRYPNAVVIYVHLWSLRMTVDNAKTGEKPRDVLKAGHTFLMADELINQMLGSENAVWSWGEAMVADSKQIGMDAMDAVLKVRGYLYELPLPEQPGTAFSDHWFGPDYHHLSVAGHRLVATGLADLLKTTKSLTGADAKYGSRTWGKGDQCFSWYEHGKHDAVSITGGTMKMFVKPDKWALHIGMQFGQPASIAFPNIHHETQPVELVLMSWGPGVYPESQVTLASIDKSTPDQSFLLNPLHPSDKQRVFHVTRTIHIGWAEPGQNQLVINPMEVTQRPLRVTGIVMCGACIEMDSTYLSLDAGQGHGALEGATNFLPPL